MRNKHTPLIVTDPRVREEVKGGFSLWVVKCLCGYQMVYPAQTMGEARRRLEHHDTFEHRPA